MTDATPAGTLAGAEAEVDLPAIPDTLGYHALKPVIRSRVAARKFDQHYVVPATDRPEPIQPW